MSVGFLLYNVILRSICGLINQWFNFLCRNFRQSGFEFELVPGLYCIILSTQFVG